jgi:hypothetical protein
MTKKITTPSIESMSPRGGGGGELRSGGRRTGPFMAECFAKTRNVGPEKRLKRQLTLFFTAPV